MEFELDQHTMYVTGEIDTQSFNRFSRRLRKLENEGVKEITLEIISEGGDAYAALAFYDRIVGSRVVFKGVATGLVASAAILIFMACDERYMTQSAWLMVHEDSLGGIEDSKVSQIEKEARHGRRLENQWCRLLESVVPASKPGLWKKLHKNETYLDAEECLQYGILTGVKK